ncbi:MAG: hypothetical protein AAF938_30635, partial [Myxococcota bacterium]
GEEVTDVEDLVRGVNIEDCMSPDNTILTVTIDPTVTPVPPNVDLWYGVDDCSPTTTRNGADVSCAHATNLRVSTADGEERTFQVALSAFMDGENANDFCEVDGGTVASMEATRIVTALYSGTPMDINDVGEDYGNFPLIIDTTPPAAPTVSEGAREQSGDTRVSISWDRGSVSENNPRFQVVDGGDCGGEPPSSPAAVSGITDIAVDSLNLSPLDDLGLAVGQQAGVHVVAIDQAGNVGALSEEICVTRVSTVGFCDVLAGDAGRTMDNDPCGGDGCAVSTPGSGRGRTWLLLVVTGLLWLRLR